MLDAILQQGKYVSIVKCIFEICENTLISCKKHLRTMTILGKIVVINSGKSKTCQYILHFTLKHPASDQWRTGQDVDIYTQYITKL